MNWREFVLPRRPAPPRFVRRVFSIVLFLYSGLPTIPVGAGQSGAVDALAERLPTELAGEPMLEGERKEMPAGRVNEQQRPIRVLQRSPSRFVLLSSFGMINRCGAYTHFGHFRPIAICRDLVIEP